MAGHSKLPWKVSKASPDGKELFVRGDDVTIVACRHRLPYPLSNTNMKFIVLACNSHDALLEAAKRAERILAAMVDRQWSEGYDPIRDMIDAWPQLREAIALATPSASKESRNVTRDEAISQVGGPTIDTEKVKMHVSILYVLEQLRTQENNINPNLLVIRECVRELRRYET